VPLCGGGLEYLYRSPASRRRRRKGNPVPGGISGPPCHWGDINTETLSSGLGVGRNAVDLALWKRNIYILLRNPEKWRPNGLIETSVAESSKEGYGLKWALLPMMMVMMCWPCSLCADLVHFGSGLSLRSRVNVTEFRSWNLLQEAKQSKQKRKKAKNNEYCVLGCNSV
jgi:hypothetical protein